MAMKQIKPMLKRIGKRVPSLPLLGLALAGTAFAQTAKTGTAQVIPPTEIEKAMPQHPYVGMWVTDDNRVRHELLPNGRYDEARDQRESAFQGRYEVHGTYIEYWDDTGFTADGDFVDLNTLHHGGMILRRRP